MKTVNQMREDLTKAGLYPLRKQGQLWDSLLKERLETVLPKAMADAGVDCWLVISREDNEDAVMKSLMSHDMPHARRITALVFYRDSAGLMKRYVLGGPSPVMSELYEPVKDPDRTTWKALNDLLIGLNPNVIAINKSLFKMDGLSAGLCEQLHSELDQSLVNRFVGGEDLCVYYLQSLCPSELPVISALVNVTKDIVKLAFSKVVIKPGVTTTTDDVEWFMRETISELGLDFWFGPDVNFQRLGSDKVQMMGEILPGDLLHCDIGVFGRYVPLHSDIQWLAYLCKDGESDAPDGIKALFDKAKTFQDITISHMKPGPDGNAVFAAAMTEAKTKGLKPCLYTHPIGHQGHGPGPIIGLYNDQGGFIAHTGERKLMPNCAFSLELNVKDFVPEWNQEVFAYVEDEVWLNDSFTTFLSGRQDELIII